MATLKLTSPIPPSVNHYLSYKVVKNRASGKFMAMSYATKEAKEYKESFANYLIDEVTKQGWDLEPNKETHFYVTVTAYFPRVDMDVNNYWKCMLDAITDTGIIWIDDNVVCERVDHIYYDRINPRFEITIKPVDYIGIFDSQKEKDRFFNRCEGCERNKRNCKIKENTVKGIIQPEVIVDVCTKRKELKEK